ncbi:hypothetical protein SAMN05444372_108147 [Flavobacterium micromati]|uniref:Alpha-ketoglutarate decarboxylase n=1 Tax=Flavobacterium micromati TaxID=229205 RepID=A0A1M5LQC8_9FLAO|nr:hypothetical protein [Flavobacterium micromati]SHG66809.1 hypothetical protein SAMN05444372_108147 [Flavobacterium micromati]
MRNNTFVIALHCFLLITTLLGSATLCAQQNNGAISTQNDFWKNVQFGGGLGLGFGSGFTDITVAPSAIYNFNEYIALGIGAQYSYLKQRDFFATNLYGGSLITLANPIPQIQLSAELEQLRVNQGIDGTRTNSLNYWNTALFVGVGYRSGFATIGVRYNVLNDSNNIYGSAFMPFVRVFF